jgi:chitodextrinase
VNADYKANDIVSYNGVLWKCYKAGGQVAGAVSPPSLPNSWVKLTSDAFVLWSAGVSYNIDEMVAYVGKIYKVVTPHLSSVADLPSTSAKWTEVLDKAVPVWNVNTQYTVNDIVSFNGKLYKCKVNTNGGLDPYQSPNKWSPVVSDVMPIWSETGYYPINGIVAHKGKLYKALQENWGNALNAPDLDKTEWSELSTGGSGSPNLDGGKPDTIYGGLPSFDAGTV